MELFEAIKQRHSYRGDFKNEVIPRLDLQKIVQAGIDAPSGKNAQTTIFGIIDDPFLIQKINQLGSNHPTIHQAVAFIACIIDQKPDAVYHSHSFQIEDCAAAVENMLLAITALGYASVWIDGWLRIHNHAQQVNQLLNIPSEKTVQILLPIGIPAVKKLPAPKKKFEERAWYNNYEEFLCNKLL